MTDVFCVGIATLDRVKAVDRLPRGPGKYRATSSTVIGGGVAANAAVAIARLGGHARFMSVVGDDDVGTAIIKGLESEGVDHRAVRVIADRCSPESTVLIAGDGERLIVNHASPDLFDLAHPPEPEEIGEMQAVLVDMRWPAGAVPALRSAKDQRVPGVVDCDHDPTESPGVLEAASHIVFALPTLEVMTGHADPVLALKTAARQLTAWIAVTAGEDGTYWIDGDTVRHLPATAVDAVDTLGAGDVFHGAFTLALAEGSSLPDAIGRASAAAALKCTRFGGRSGIPTKEELDRFLEKR